MFLEGRDVASCWIMHCKSMSLVADVFYIAEGRKRINAPVVGLLCTTAETSIFMTQTHNNRAASASAWANAAAAAARCCLGSARKNTGRRVSAAKISHLCPSVMLLGAAGRGWTVAIQALRKQNQDSGLTLVGGVHTGCSHTRRGCGI